MKTLKTKLHRYYLHMDVPEEAATYDAMIKDNNLRARKEMHCISGVRLDDKHRQNVVEECEIELTHMFENQWDSTTERVFDWYEEIFPNKSTKKGHWLEITPEMQAARHDTFKCGYCGRHYGPYHGHMTSSGFCDACLDSPYLKQEELHLLRLVRLSCDTRGKKFAKLRPPLTEEETALLLPLYVQRQTTGSDSRAKAARDKQRQDVVDKFNKTVAMATAEKDGMLWLWDAGLSLDNVIFYDHTGEFCFGWRSPLSSAVVEELKVKLQKFPFQYEFKI